jgi:formate dehydrogenase subunit gamma
MGLLKSMFQWATDPGGKIVPIHIAWFLIWVSAIAGLLFLIIHATYVRYFARPRQFADDPAARRSAIPARVPRHSRMARMFHWVMALAMLTLLFTAFLPKIGFQFAWVTYHWIAGIVLTASVLFHIFHASFWLDFWSIWPDRIDMTDAYHRVLRFLGRDAPPPR